MAGQANLEEIATEVRRCKLCRLHEGRIQAVPGEGESMAAILLIGEAPGSKEDETGRPFVGMAGKTLDLVLHQAGLDRSEVFITNTVKCRPPDNRSPRADEVKACRPYLLRQIESVRPSVIVTLGSIGLRALLGSEGNVKDLRKERLQFQGIPVVATYHPAARFGRTLRRKLLEDLMRAIAITHRQ